jgi:hypothetical protein
MDRYCVPYSNVDKKLVAPLVALIRATDTSVFRDCDSIQPGQEWRVVLAETMSECQTVLVMWSAASSRS